MSSTAARFRASLAFLILWCLPTGARGSAAPSPEAAPLKVPWTRFPKPEGLSYGGRFFTTVAPDLVMKGPYEDRLEWHSGLDFRVAYQFAPNARFSVEAKARYDLRVGDRVEADFLMDLGDTWLQFRVGKLTVRAGRETMKWGQNTVISKVDRLNPIDYTRTLGGAGLEDGKIPVLVVRGTLNLAPFALEVVYLPLFSPQRAALYGRDFAALRPGMLEEALPEAAPSTSSGAVNQQLDGLATRLRDELVAADPYARDGIQSYLIANLPEELPWNGDFGARVGFTGRGFDLNGYLLWHIFDRPEVTLDDAIRVPLLQDRLPNQNELTRLGNGDQPLVQTSYTRSLMAGIDAAVALGDFVVTAEVAADSTTVHYRKTLEPYRTPMVRYAVELRYQYASTLALTVGVSHDILIRPAADTLMERQHGVSIALIALVRVLRERVQLLGSVSYNPVWGDLYIHPRVTVEVQDRVNLLFGLQLFESFRPDAQNSLAGLLAYTGGPVGYFRDNDYGYGMVQIAF